jgi:hypothetical protein
MITYEIKPDRRDLYLGIVRELRREFTSLGIEYSVYEQHGSEGTFNEMFVCPTQADYDSLEDKTSDAAETLIDRLAQCVRGKMRYTTLHESA